MVTKNMEKGRSKTSILSVARFYGTPLWIIYNCLVDRIGEIYYIYKLVFKREVIVLGYSI
jgi:hypothetical protein